MPRQNRVTPFGTIVRPPAGSAGRGDFLGNRGCLHDDQGQLRGRRWRTRAWITCRLAFKGRRRALMQPRRWTELFFLDEATAFAAGHRPCAECRREDYERFAAIWRRTHPEDTRADAIDARLHSERLVADRGARLHQSMFDELPDGAFVLDDG